MIGLPGFHRVPLVDADFERVTQRNWVSMIRFAEWLKIGGAFRKRSSIFRCRSCGSRPQFLPTHRPPPTYLSLAVGSCIVTSTQISLRALVSVRVCASQAYSKRDTAACARSRRVFLRGELLKARCRQPDETTSFPSKSFSPLGGTTSTTIPSGGSDARLRLRSESRRGVITFPMRLILLFQIIAFVPAAFADVGDVYIPQCDRARDRCIKWALTTGAVEQCRRTREICRTATINEAVRNSGMSATELFDRNSARTK